MFIKCPHCLNPIDIVPNRPVEAVTCPTCGSSFSLLSGDTAVVDTLSFRETAPISVGRFQLLELLGSGHFGDVWKAKDPELDRFVALKLPRKEELERADIEVFVREARAAAQLKHPHIVGVHEVSRDADRVYIVSDLVEGPNLADWIRDRKLPLRESAELVATLAEAIHHAHDNGVIHRDLKPSNVLLGPDNAPHLTDFGLAKRDGAEITVTIDGRIMGTPAYMSPEQARGDAHNADRRSDVYSLGVILYELLAGERPFASNSKQMMIQRVLHEEPAPPRKIKASIPRDLETICLKALSKEPDRRYQTAREMADDLRRYLDGRPILARPVSIIEKAWRWSRRNRALAGSLLVIASLLTLLTGLYGATRPLKYTVRITTQPEGANVTFIPLSGTTGEPQAARSVFAGRSPVATKLAPGRYLVVAYTDDQRRFHEVFRRVPYGPQEIPEMNNHNFWKMSEPGVVDLSPIKIPEAAVTAGMALIDGSDGFAVGVAGLEGLTPHIRRVPAFHLDPTEVSLAQWKQSPYRRVPKSLVDAPDSHPMTGISWDQAVACAEAMGKRLPDEFEFESAATAQGKRRFPWGSTPPPPGNWTRGPTDDPTEDRTETVPPVLRLCSNAAEWTGSWAWPYRKAREAWPPVSAVSNEKRIVRGAPLSIINGTAAADESSFDARLREGRDRIAPSAGVGFRCARSVRPRLRPEDFTMAVPSLR